MVEDGVNKNINTGGEIDSQTDTGSNLSLKERFQAKLDELTSTHPKERDRILGGLVHYTSAVSEDQELTIWQVIEKQIEYHVGQSRLQGGYSTTAEEIVDQLFTPDRDGKIDAEMIIGRLQIT